jgi:hypothetical protein
MGCNNVFLSDFHVLVSPYEFGALLRSVLLELSSYLVDVVHE